MRDETPVWHGATEGTSARAESNLMWLSCESALYFPLWFRAAQER